MKKAPSILIFLSLVLFSCDPKDKTFTLTVTAPTNGTIEVKDGETVLVAPYEVAQETLFTLTATANDQHRFSTWTDSNTSKENPISIKMDGNKTIGATFEPWNKSWKTLKMGGLTDSQYSCHLYATDGTLYTTSDNSVQKWDKTTSAWVQVGESLCSTPKHYFTKTVLIENNGKIYLAFFEGKPLGENEMISGFVEFNVKVLNNSTWEDACPKPSHPSPLYNAVKFFNIDSRGNLFAILADSSTGEGYVAKYDGTQWTTLGTPYVLTNTNLYIFSDDVYLYNGLRVLNVYKYNPSENIFKKLGSNTLTALGILPYGDLTMNDEGILYASYYTTTEDQELLEYRKLVNNQWETVITDSLSMTPAMGFYKEKLYFISGKPSVEAWNGYGDTLKVLENGVTTEIKDFQLTTEGLYSVLQIGKQGEISFSAYSGNENGKAVRSIWIYD